MRKEIKNELGRLVRFIFEETGQTPIYIDEEIAVFRRTREFDWALAIFGRLNKVEITYGRGYVLMEVI